jgi:hypothetical protein
MPHLNSQMLVISRNRMTLPSRRPAVITLLAVIFALATILGPPATAENAAQYGHLNPKAPPETQQFAFIVGAWTCKTRFMKPDGSGFSEGKATWTGRYILDGWAVCCSITVK